MTIRQIYDQTVKPLSVGDRLRLAAIILNDIPSEAIVQDSDSDLEDEQEPAGSVSGN